MAIDLVSAESGTTLATLDCPGRTREELADYARASGDLNPLHLDEAFARKAGFGDLVVHGMLNMAALGRLLTDHFEPDTILGFSSRFEGVLLVGEPTRLSMTLLTRADGIAAVGLEMLTHEGRRIVGGRAMIRLE
jgi:acyl dehydratase